MQMFILAIQTLKLSGSLPAGGISVLVLSSACNMTSIEHSLNARLWYMQGHS